VSWVYRAAMAAIFAILLAALFADGELPGIGGWIALAVVALGGLYEDRWSFDAAAGRISHRAGLVFIARRRTIALADIARLRLAPFVQGTIPGTEDESAQNAAALAGRRGDDASGKRSSYKKPYLCLVMDTLEGASYFVNAMPARRGAELRSQASGIAEFCGKDVSEG